jgi:hypothetical protein
MWLQLVQRDDNVAAFGTASMLSWYATVAAMNTLQQ